MAKVSSQILSVHPLTNSILFTLVIQIINELSLNFCIEMVKLRYPPLFACFQFNKISVRYDLFLIRRYQFHRSPISWDTYENNFCKIGHRN